MTERGDDSPDVEETPADREVEETDPESARVLEMDARDRLSALGIDRDEGMVLAKEYVALGREGDVDDFIEYVRAHRPPRVSGS